ncbi:MAG: cation:proton antiporter [Cyanobacteria bacterium TGS_CYA1]|nr:cation:proton antiporter [Cyanobacteria bacterium TGS_CYA1]
MKNTDSKALKTRLLVLLVLLWTALTPLPSCAQTNYQYGNEPTEFCDIYVGKEKIFSVTNTRFISALERGERINERLEDIVADPRADLNQLNIKTGIDGIPVIRLDESIICSVRPLDCQVSEKSADALANDWMEKIRSHIKDVKKEAQKAGTAPQGEKKTNSNLSEHAVLLLFIEIAILLFTSLVCGEIMVRLGQPAIIGQIFAGLLLGQTFFGAFMPDLSNMLFPNDGSQSRLIEVVSWIGVSFLLMMTGMETDASMLKKLGKPLLYFGTIGLAGPLIIGALGSLMMPDVLMGSTQNKLAFAVFIGTVFAASSVPVVAKILMDMKMLKLDTGQLVIGTSLVHDLLCCLLLAVIVVLSGSQEGSGANPILVAIIGTACFLAIMYFGRPVFFTILRWVNDHVSSKEALITAMVVLLLSCAATTQALGVHIVLGAFAAGVILSQAPVINHKVVKPLETVTMGFFAPIFFASSGLSVNLSSLLDPMLGTITILISLATILSKLATCYLAGRLTGIGTHEALSVGVGANAKGSLGLILAMLGYSLNIISLDMYAVVIFVSLFSTAVTAPLMKKCMSKVKVTQEQKERIKQEERKAQTILSSIRRVLLPISDKRRNPFISHLLNSIGQSQVIETTALWVKEPDTDPHHLFSFISSILNKKYVSLLQKTATSESKLEAITEEANRGYDLIIMATDEPAADADYVFGELVDSVILNTTNHTLVIYDPDPTGNRVIKKVLVPVSGSELSLAAAEFAISLAKSLDASVTCLSIVESDVDELYSEYTQSGIKIQNHVNKEIEASLKDLSKALDVDFDPLMVQTKALPAQAVVMTADQHNIDLIVLGAEPKLGKNLFFGHTINFVLRNAPCAVTVLKI